MQWGFTLYYCLALVDGNGAVAVFAGGGHHMVPLLRQVFPRVTCSTLLVVLQRVTLHTSETTPLIINERLEDPGMHPTTGVITAGISQSTSMSLHYPVCSVFSFFSSN